MEKESSNKKENSSGFPPCPPEGWTRCNTYIERKSRFCRQEVIPGTKYCGNHAQFVLNEPSTLEGIPSKKRKRVPCPVDPSHTVLEDMLEKHIKICPKTKEQRFQREQEFYKHNLNTGGHGDLHYFLDGADDNNQIHTAESMTLDQAKRLAIRILHAHHELFSTDSTTSANAENVRLENILGALPLIDLSKPEMESGLPEELEMYRIKSGGPRHIHQQASLVGHMRKIGVFNHDVTDEQQNNKGTPKSMTIVEMGAGRGMTGLIAAGAAAATVSSRRSEQTNNNKVNDESNAQTKNLIRLIMVERAASRSRADKILRKAQQLAEQQYGKDTDSSKGYLRLNEVDWDRVQCDLAHADMANVLDREKDDNHESNRHNDDIIIIAKHLCGVGTDLALKSLEPIKDRVTACIMSTCCHGVCFWKDYVGRDYLGQVMVNSKSLEGKHSCLSRFGDAEFDLLRLWSSGSVRDIDPLKEECKCEKKDSGNNGIGKIKPSDSKEDDEHSKNMENIRRTANEKNLVSITQVVEALNLNCGAQGLGRACQRLIDYGRLEYMRDILFPGIDPQNAQLLYYVPVDVTPQNALLLVHR